MEAPGYGKPVHQYGIDLGFWSLPADLIEELSQPEEWAGEGFTRRDEESTT